MTERALVIINPATSVRCRYYFRFAQYLFDQGLDVLTYDYRGIGESRPESLKGFEAGWLTWGQQDFEGVLQHVQTHSSAQPLWVVGHSIGGVLVGLAPSNTRISRVLTMGSQQAYWPDYKADKKIGMLLKWHALMPLIARALDYLPAKRLGWMEDTPKQVALNWAQMGRHFIPSLVKSPQQQRLLQYQFEQLQAPILALSAHDDPFGTEPAIARMLALFGKAHRHHVRLDPQQLNLDAIGHFAFFNDRFKETLWPLALNWLTQQTIPTPSAGLTVTRLAPHCD